jgi:hypothetical protein
MSLFCFSYLYFKSVQKRGEGVYFERSLHDKFTIRGNTRKCALLEESNLDHVNTSVKKQCTSMRKNFILQNLYSFSYLVWIQAKILAALKILAGCFISERAGHYVPVDRYNTGRTCTSYHKY